MPEGAYLLCPTHIGDLDGYFIRRALRRLGSGKRNRYFFRLKAGPWVQRVFLLYWRGWIIDAPGPNVAALHGALDWLDRGNPVTIFPEGLEHGQGVLHLGAALLACRSGRPILPLQIDRGVFVKEETVFYALPLLTLLNYLREAPRVSLTFCEPLQPDLERYHREGVGAISRSSARNWGGGSSGARWRSWDEGCPPVPRMREIRLVYTVPHNARQKGG